MKISNEFKVGLLTVIAIAVLFYGFNFLMGKNILKSQNEYLVSYEKVAGLTSGNSVMLNGFKIGIVESVELKQTEFQNTIDVVLNIDGDVKIPQGSSARIVSADLLGDKAVNIVYPKNDSNQAFQYATSGDRLIGTVEQDLTEAVKVELLPVKAKVEELFGSLDSLLNVVTGTLSSKRVENTIDNIDKSFTSVEEVLRNLKKVTNSLGNLVVEEDNRLRSIIRNVDKISKSLVDNTDVISSILGNFDTLSEDLGNADISNTMVRLNETLIQAEGAMAEFNTLLNDVNNGDGSIQQLLKNDGLYNNLEKAALDLDKLLINLKENPGEYVHFSVFGKKKKD